MFDCSFLKSASPTKRAENENHRFQLLRQLLTTLERPMNELSSPGVFVLQEPSSLEVLGENKVTSVFMSCLSFHQEVRQGWPTQIHHTIKTTAVIVRKLWKFRLFSLTHENDNDKRADRIMIMHISSFKFYSQTDLSNLHFFSHISSFLNLFIISQWGNYSVSAACMEENKGLYQLYIIYVYHIYCSCLSDPQFNHLE